MIKPFPKPLPFCKPHVPLLCPKQRLPERKPVTIVAGFANNNGVVLAADSQEVISDYAKSTTHKIARYVCGYEWEVAIAGAGDDMVYFDLFKDELSDALFALEKYDYDKMVAITKGALHKLHKQHIWPQRGKRPVGTVSTAIQIRAILAKWTLGDRCPLGA